MVPALVINKLFEDLKTPIILFFGDFGQLNPLISEYHANPAVITTREIKNGTTSSTFHSKTQFI